MNLLTLLCHRNKISSRIIEDVMSIINNAKSASDRVNLAEIWKGKMRKIEKLRKCLKNLIKQNNENLNEFNIDKLFEPSLNQNDEHTSAYSSINTNLNDPNSLDGLDTIEVTVEDLYLKLISDWIVPTREDYEEERKKSQDHNENWAESTEPLPKSKSKKKNDIVENNKIVMKI